MNKANIIVSINSFLLSFGFIRLCNLIKFIRQLRKTEKEQKKYQEKIGKYII